MNEHEILLSLETKVLRLKEQIEGGHALIKRLKFGSYGFQVEKEKLEAKVEGLALENRLIDELIEKIEKKKGDENDQYA